MRKFRVRDEAEEGGVTALHHTGVDLGIDLDPRIRWDPRLGELDSFVDGNAIGWPVSITGLGRAAKSSFLDSPLPDDGIVFHAGYPNGSARAAQRDTRITHLLMLSILSILVMPSQCRISGIRAWNRISLTPAMFSVRLK